MYHTCTTFKYFQLISSTWASSTQLLKSGTVSLTMLLEQFLIWGSSLLKAMCMGFFWKTVIHNLSVSSSPIDNNNFTELQWTICLAFWILGVLVGYCSHMQVQWNLVIKRSDITKPSYNKVIFLVPALYIYLFFTLI